MDLLRDVGDTHARFWFRSFLLPPRYYTIIVEVIEQGNQGSNSVGIEGIRTLVEEIFFHLRDFAQ